MEHEAKSPLVNTWYEIAAWHGKCTRDVMWTGIWGWASVFAWGLHAKIMDNPVCGLLLHTTPLHICHSSPQAPRPRRRNCRTSRRIHHSSHPSNVFPRHKFPHPEVLAGPKQGWSSGMDWPCGSYHTHWGALSPHQCLQVGHSWCRSSL